MPTDRGEVTVYDLLALDELALPEGVVPISPEGVVPISPEGVVPISPEGVVPTSAEGVVPTSPEGVVPTSPEGVVPTSPEGVVPTIPEGVVPIGKANTSGKPKRCRHVNKAGDRCVRKRGHGGSHRVTP